MHVPKSRSMCGEGISSLIWSKENTPKTLKMLELILKLNEERNANSVFQNVSPPKKNPQNG